MTFFLTRDYFTTDTTTTSTETVTTTSAETSTVVSAESTTVTLVQTTTSTVYPTTTVTTALLPGSMPCTFYVYTDGINYDALNCVTGTISYGGPENAGGTAGDDAALVIGDAINSTAAGNGGAVVLGTGDYRIKESIDLYEGVWLEGLDQGWTANDNGAVIQTSGNYSALIFKSYRLNGSLLYLGRLSNILLLGSANVLDTGNFGITSTDNSSHDFYVDHVAINDFYTGIYATEPKLRISDSTIEGNLKYGLYLQGLVADLNDLYIRTNGLGNGGFGAYIRSGTVQLENSQVWLNNAGVVLYDDTACLNCDDYIVSGNWFNSNTGTNTTNADLYLIGFPGYPMNAVITGNDFAATSGTNVPAHDVSIETSQGGVITGNDFESTSYSSSAVAYGTGSTTVLSTNVGFNPVNKIAYPWASGTVGLGGDEATPGRTGGTYTLVGVWASFACSGGGSPSIIVKDGVGDSLASAYTCSNLPSTFYPPGYSITISNSTDFTTFSVYGD